MRDYFSILFGCLAVTIAFSSVLAAVAVMAYAIAGGTLQ